MEASGQKQVFVISGPTGSGESSITNAIVKRYPQKIVRLVTATTRSPRPGEQNGVDYYFFTQEEFHAKERAGEMLETTYIKNRDTYYGTYTVDLQAKLDAGYIVVVNTDVVGTKFYKERYGAIGIFVMPGAMDEIPGRLRTRNPEMDETEISKRYENAVREVAEERSYYDYEVVNENGKLDTAVEEVIAILKKESYNI